MWGNYATYWLRDPLAAIKRSSTPQHLKILHDFMADLPYEAMSPANEVVSPAEVIVDGQPYRTNFCLALAGRVYLIFSLNGGTLTVTLDPGDYQAIQLDPRTGEQQALGCFSGGRQALLIVGQEQVLLFTNSQANP
jgi:hypothetical protein